MASYLIMLQTNSNQPFILSSPRLREQIGASFEITLLSHWVEEETKELLRLKELPSSFWVSDSSGKVIVRFGDTDGDPKELAKRLIREVTLRALTDAPGLDVTGVFIETSSDPVNPGDLNRLDRAFSEYSLNRRPAAARFPQFPFLERGSESALPASPKLSEDDCREMRRYARKTLNVPLLTGEDTNFSPPTQTVQDAQESLSLPSRVKRALATTSREQQVKDVQNRLKKLGKSLEQEPQLDPTKLAAAFQDGEESEDAKDMLSSVGVVHIDGNGVGAIMRDLKRAHDAVRNIAKKQPDMTIVSGIDDFQSFIMSVNKRLDDVVKDAIALSWYDVQELTPKNAQEPTPKTVVPIVPVLVGGDDVTVYTDGRYAIPFAEAYIRHYEELTKDDDLLSVLAIVAGGKKPDAPKRECFEIEDYIIQNPGPLTASAGVAIVGRNFPFHIAYDLAEELVSRGKELGKYPGTVPCSTINFHVLRDATVLYPDDTLDEYKGRTQRPFLIGHYAEERIMAKSDTSPKDWWAQILRTVVAFDGKKPDDPTQTTGDPFPRARANRIVKLLAESGAEKAATEWDDALQNAPSAGLLAKQLKLLPPQSSSSNEADESSEQIKWLLDLIDLSGNLPDGYLVSRIGKNTDDAGPQETADHPTEGGAK